MFQLHKKEDMVPDSQFLSRRDELERLAFRHYLRTGRKIDLDTLPAEIEAKFNPYHDPDNGRFTTAEGAGAGGSAKLIPPGRSPLRQRRAEQPASEEARLPKRLPSRRNDGRPVPTLSPLHNEIRALGVQVPPARGTKEWTNPRFAEWVASDGDIHAFKRQWIRGYRDAINTAAKRFDLPAELVAGTVYNEVGGDPPISDGIYAFRDSIGSSARDRTSLGDVSVQVRRAIEALGYDREKPLSSLQRRLVIAALQDPQTGIFIAAKHLSDLRDIDFRGTPGRALSRRQIEAIGARYNRGPHLTRNEIDENLDYGQDITKRWALFHRLIK